MTYQPITADDLTVRGLADWLDRVRTVGAVEGQPIRLEATHTQGNPITAPDISVEIDQ